MSKIFTVLAIALLASFYVQAQDQKVKTKRVSFGLKAGVNYTHLNLKDLDDEVFPNQEENWRSGLALGAFMNIQVAKSFSIQPEFLYSSMGGDYVDPQGRDIKARYNFFSIPVLAKYAFAKKWVVVAGPQFDFLIQAKETSHTGTFDVTNQMKDHDILATGGLEFWPCRNFVLGARYMRGFNDIDYRSNGMRYFQEGVQVTAGIKF